MIDRPVTIADRARTSASLPGGAPDERADRRHPCDPAACALAAAERIIEILDVAIDDRGEAHWVTTGGSAPGAIYEHLASDRCATSSTGGRSTSGAATTGSSRSTTRSRTPRSPSTGCWTRRIRRESGTGQSGADVMPVATRASRSAATTSTRSRSPTRSPRAATRTGRASRYVEEIRADGPDEDDDGLAGLRPDPPRRRAGRAHPVGLPGLGGVRRAGVGRRGSGADARRAARRAGHPEPRARSAPRTSSSSSRPARPRRTCWPTSSGPRGSAPAAGPARPAGRATWILDRAAAARL